MQERTNTVENENVTMPVSEKYMLTIREASVYFNIGVKKMRRLAEDLENARKELEKNKEEKPVSQKMFRTI